MPFQDRPRLFALHQLLQEVLPSVPFAFDVERYPLRSDHLTLLSNKKCVHFEEGHLDGQVEILVRFGFLTAELPVWRLMSLAPFSECENRPDGEWIIVSPEEQLQERVPCIADALKFFLALFSEDVHRDAPKTLRRYSKGRIEEIDFHQGMIPLTEAYRNDPRAQIAMHSH